MSTQQHEVSEVTRQLIERDQRGRAKYGTSLDRTDLNLPDWLQHMAEELLDAAGYALAAKRQAMNSVSAVDVHGLPALVAEGLDYFERSGDEGDRKYVAAIREHMAALRQSGEAVAIDWPTGVLNRTDTLNILREHNAWRRGALGEQTDARMLGLALEAAIAAIASHDARGGR